MHTPGPWEKESRAPNSPNRYFIKGSVGGYVALVYDYADETEANAALIAAAPELLEALINCEAAIRSWRNVDGFRLPASDELLSVCNKAISKARGE